MRTRSHASPAQPVQQRGPRLAYGAGGNLFAEKEQIRPGPAMSTLDQPTPPTLPQSVAVAPATGSCSKGTLRALRRDQQLTIADMSCDYQPAETKEGFHDQVTPAPGFAVFANCSLA